jgi:hypothetical protein
MQFLILTRRDPSTDFRRALAGALREEGYDCYVVLVRKELVIDGPRENDPVLRLSPIKFVRFLRKLVVADDTIVVDSLNLGDPIFCLLLRVMLWRSVWAYDIHDYLLYDLRGLKRVVGKASLRIHLLISNFSFHASPSLLELYPKSLRLGNASHLVRRKRKLDNLHQILVLASIDERFDFELVRGILSENKVELHVFGSLAEGSTTDTQLSVRSALNNLCSEFPNFSYCGAYNNQAIEGILDNYQIMLAPYKSDHFSTRYIEPLRYYHALNRGLEIISTPIPALCGLTDFIHVVHSADDFRLVLRDLSKSLDSWRNDGNRFKAVTWHIRAKSLVALAQNYIVS